MFYYVFSVARTWTYDDVRVVDDRAEALMYMKVLRMRPRVVVRI